MECPNCGDEIGSDLDYTLTGQGMCPVCGEIVDLLTDKGEYDETEIFENQG